MNALSALVCWPGCVSKCDSTSQQGFADERQEVFPEKVLPGRKVLKKISIGDLKPNETVEANLEAQLLSKLDHPAIVKFYASFVERDSFCIITEYCEGGDLDFKIQEYKDSGKMFTQSQVIDWFIQLLLGVNYMHERKILHRDLKAKNIFLRDNLLKIGDFGVSCLLMGSCDLATTFTGTPYYMSPEVLKHQGYNTKSDIWSLGCILYEMCCMNHAFTGQNFLSVVLKIVEGETPSLPDRYPSKLNAVLCSMLNKNPSLRPAAAEILKTPYIDEQLKKLQYKCTNMTVRDKLLKWQKETVPIFGAVQRKVHLQTLQELSEVQKMTPRERMRLRKLNAADERAKKLQQLAEEKYQENFKRMQEFRSRNFRQLNVSVLHESDEQTSEHLLHSQPVTTWGCVSLGPEEPSGNETTELCMSELTDHEIPEDPEIAEEYYKDEFESCSEDGEEEEDTEASQTVSKSNHQNSDMEAMVKYLESVLNHSSLGSGTVTGVSPGAPQAFGALNCTMAGTKLRHMRESAIGKLGVEVFEAVYSYLKQARQQKASEEQIRRGLEKLVSRASDCFEVDQLLYFEEQLQAPGPCPQL
ncbi:Serine/threonine-protein kinase Nek11 [Willisornis vidua]|uniref:non-specific serine/threonine protein kinase n=1 Tax=Willisornis vidua TaxID=1566151 RepID=A0ABQ9DHZ1_9PASS|nr:Serine/threonine-protein kinase Nek11 [Willisornis vidua]